MLMDRVLVYLHRLLPIFVEQQELINKLIRTRERKRCNKPADKRCCFDRLSPGSRSYKNNNVASNVDDKI